MADEAAEVVAIVRAETDEFDRAMDDANTTIKESTEGVKTSERDKQNALGATGAELGKVRLGWAAAGLAAASAGVAFLRSSTLLQASLGDLGDAAGGLADEVVAGFSLDTLVDDLTTKVDEAAQKAADLADKGGGNILAGAVVEASETAIAARERGGQAGAPAPGAGPLERTGQGALGVLDLLLAVGQGAVGQAEAGVESIERGRARIGGAINPPTEQRIIVEANEPNLKRLMDDYISRRMAQQLGGSLP